MEVVMRIGKLLFASVALTFILSAQLFAQPSGTVWSRNVALLAKNGFSGFGSSDVWHWRNPQDGKDYALATIDKGLSILDVSTPTNPTEVVHINAENHTKGSPSSPNLAVNTVESYESGR